MDNQKIGSFLAQLRRNNNLTQTKLAEILNVTHQAISRWETGESIPDIQMLIDLSKLYNITIDEILNGEIPVDIKTDNNVFDDIVYKVKKLNIIAFFLVVTGLILFYGITWLTYYEVLGITIQFVTLVISCTISLFGYYDLKKALNKINDKEIYLCTIKYLKKTIIVGITIIVMSIFLSIPYIIFDNYLLKKSIISLYFYISILPYFIITGVLISLLFVKIIDKYYYKKWNISQLDFLKYVPYYLMILISIYLFPINIQFINRLVNITIVGLGFLIIDDIHEIIRNKNFRILRIVHIVLSLCIIFIACDNYINIFLLIFLYFVLFIGYLIDYIIKFKNSSVYNRIINICRLVLLSLLIVYAYLVYYSLISMSHFYRKLFFTIKFYSPTNYLIFILVYIIIDLFFRIIINRLEK